jgi:hypothetical protein
MIIWLASYPKSGNTWVRHFLASLIYSNQGKSGLDKLGFILQYPKRDQFEKLVTNLNDFRQIKKNWIKSQDLINSDNKIKIFKTHHTLCTFEGDNFTNEKNTLGAIYIVRDPRNVISSILYHFNLSNIEEALNFIKEEKRFIMGNIKNKVNYPLLTLIGSWKSNYNSWKNIGKNFLLVKYENLILNPNYEFNRITKHISKITNLRFSKEQINQSIEESSFKNLSSLEDKNGFVESIEDLKNKKKKFFNLGPKNNWQKILDKKYINEIESFFSDEMKELGYI